MNTEDPKVSELKLSTVIRLFRELAFLGVLVFLAVKLFSGNLGLDFAKLSATELVNLLLAFFSIALSAAFYFAATSQSNQFYDNVNKFSKDTSELLGRLDEQVKGLGGRQTELKDSIDKYYNHDSVKSADKAKDEVQARAKKVEESLTKVVSDLLDKAKLSGPDRVKIQEDLRTKDAMLGELREKLGHISSDREAAVRRYTIRKIKEFGISKAIGMPLNEWAIPVISSGVSTYKIDMKSQGLITTSSPTSFDEITESGQKMLQAALESALEQQKNS